jgi:hypothetical protein
MPIEIEKNIPIPDANPRPRRKYPFPDMEIGDSFHLQSQPRSSAKIAARMRHAACTYAKRHNRPELKFSIHRTTSGVRCWRIA